MVNLASSLSGWDDAKILFDSNASRSARLIAGGKLVLMFGLPIAGRAAAPFVEGTELLLEGTEVGTATAKGLSAGAGAAERVGEGINIGYHATRAENVGSIVENGLRESLGGRAGSGIYVSDTIEGAMAEFAAHNPGITPTVLKVGYSPGTNYFLEGLTNSYIKGALPLAADTLTFESVRLPGSINVVIRNGSSVVLGVAF